MKRINKTPLKESFFEEYNSEIRQLIIATEEYNEAKTSMQDVILDLRKAARSEGRQDIVDALSAVLDSLGVPFQFENALRDVEKLIKK